MPVRLAAAGWALAVVCGTLALGVTALDRDGSRARLTATAAEQDPQASAGVLRSSVATTLLLPTGTVLLALVVGSIAVGGLLGRRVWARWVAGVAAAVGAVSAVVAAGVVDAGPRLDEWGYLGCAGALVVVLALALTRTVGRWLAVGR